MSLFNFISKKLVFLYLILQMVQSINVNLETLKQSVLEIQHDLGTVNSRVMVLENKNSGKDNEIATVKSKVLTLQSFVKAQSQLGF